MALRGLRVIELAGLAPAPFCGMILADFGANVIKVDKVDPGFGPNLFTRGKRSIAVNLKSAEGCKVIEKLCSNADVLVEPYRKGVMERLNLGPDRLLSINPKLIYARLTGFGQSGKYSERAGHDINYLAVAGVLWALRREGKRPYAPWNFLADFAGGGMLCAMGILMALIERGTSGQGQVVDANMVEGSAYIASFMYHTMGMFPLHGSKPGTGLLDSGSPFYDTYRTKDDKFVAVGALEPQFFQQLVTGLGQPDLSQSMEPIQLRAKIAHVFATKTRDEWCSIFDTRDACVFPVLSPKEAAEHPHNQNSFAFTDDGWPDPKPAPRLSRTPARHESMDVSAGQHTEEVLQEAGFSPDHIELLFRNGDVKAATDHFKSQL